MALHVCLLLLSVVVSRCQQPVPFIAESSSIVQLCHVLLILSSVVLFPPFDHHE